MFQRRLAVQYRVPIRLSRQMAIDRFQHQNKLLAVALVEFVCLQRFAQSIVVRKVLGGNSTAQRGNEI